MMLRLRRADQNIIRALERQSRFGNSGSLELTPPLHNLGFRLKALGVCVSEADPEPTIVKAVSPGGKIMESKTGE